MAGKALTVHEQALIAVAAGDRSVNRSALARRLGMSRQWLGVLIGRFEVEGFAGLEPRSRAPHRPAQVDAGVEDAIVSVRKARIDAGVNAGARSIRWQLERDGMVPVPAVGTIWRVCQRRGRITPQPQKRPQCSYQRFEFGSPNACWQIDFTHWRLGDGRPVVIVNVVDDHSRVCVASVAAARSSAAVAWQGFSAAAQRWGLPEMVLSDNGLEFTGRSAGGGHFVTSLQAVGVRTINARAHHPQTCGKVERVHQTLKKFLRAQRRARSVPALQALLDRWVDHYNHEPHSALGGRTPVEQWHATPSATPGAPTAPTDQRVLTLRANTSGRIELRPWQIKLGAPWAHTTVVAFVDGLDVAIFTTDGQLIRSLRIDPDRRYQRLTNT
jgi:transposase InsO family protein